MSQKVKVSGTWRDANPYMKIDGTWKLADYVWNKVENEWYTSFVKGGLVDKSWDDADVPGGSPSFANGQVNVVLTQPDNKILIGGNFTYWNSTSSSSIARINSDGTQDLGFSVGGSANSAVMSMALQSDEKILAVGAFTKWGSTTVNRIVRLNPNGTRDTSFTANTGTGANAQCEAVRIQSDGKILVGGRFTAWNGVTRNYVVRLNVDGTLDNSFASNIGTGPNGTVFSLAVQSDNKILISGLFTSWNGTAVKYFVRLNSDGTLDTAFTANITGSSPNGYALSMAIQPDNKILIGGPIAVWDGILVYRIVRLNSNGTRDTAFNINTGTGTGSTSSVHSVALQSDGKIIFGGFFTEWNGTPVGGIVRLNSDGTHDEAFTTNTGTGTTSYIYSIAIQFDDKIIAGGNFTSFNDTQHSRLVRIGGEIAS